MADPTITGTKSSSTTSEALVTPLSGVTVTDPNTDAPETLTITLGGQGGVRSPAPDCISKATSHLMARFTKAPIH